MRKETRQTLGWPFEVFRDDNTKHEVVQCRNHEVHTKRQTDNVIKNEKRQEMNKHKTLNKGNVFPLLGGVIWASGRRRARVQFSGTLFPKFVVSDGGQNSFSICYQQRSLVAKCRKVSSI